MNSNGKVVGKRIKFVYHECCRLKKHLCLTTRRLSCSSDGKESACNAGDPGRSPGGGNGNPLQYSCLENCMDRGPWRATIHGVAKSRTWLSSHAPLCEETGSKRPHFSVRAWEGMKWEFYRTESQPLPGLPPSGVVSASGGVSSSPFFSSG